MRVSVALLIALSACGSDPIEPPDPAPVARAYAATGQTKTFDLRAQDLEWEVGVGAVYKAWTYNGTIPGPTLEAIAGDKIIIRLQNDTAHPVSIHTHIVEFSQDQDGVDPTSVAMPGQTITVEWQATFAGAFPYHDHAMEADGVARGLFGALIVHAPDETAANEHVVVMGDFDAKYYKQLPGVADPVTGMISMVGEYRGAHQYMHTINGKAYEDAVPKFTGKVGELSRWRVISIGAELHTWHIHGHRWVDGDGQLTDNIQLAPGMYRTFEFVEDKPGNWLVHCHFPNHMEGGMMARYLVEP